MSEDDDFGLPVRVIGALRRYSTSKGQSVETTMRSPDLELRDVKNIGEIALRDIRAAVARIDGIKAPPGPYRIPGVMDAICGEIQRWADIDRLPPVALVTAALVYYLEARRRRDPFHDPSF